MTTLVAIRTVPPDVSMSSNQPDGRGKRLAGEQSKKSSDSGRQGRMGMLTDGKRTAADDFENDDGFVFTRKPKKAKTEVLAATAAAAPVRRSPRNRPEPAAAAATTTAGQRTARREVASPSRDAERRRREASAGRDRKTMTTTETTTTTRSSSRREDKGSNRSRDSFPSPPRGTTTIALPTSDTPVIARNKEMRKKAAEAPSPSGDGTSSSAKDSSSSNNHRRSSFGTRGRRASSLMESGQTAFPHRDLDARDFYKHISAEGMPEPLRMKQLLTWCGDRAMPEKPRQGVPRGTALYGMCEIVMCVGGKEEKKLMRGAARGVLDVLLKDFSTRPEFSDWLGRDESVAPPTRVLKPNPRNLELDKKKASLEARIQRLQQEKKLWESIQKPPPEQPQLFPDDNTITSPTDKIQLPPIELLAADEGRIHKYLAAELEPLASVSARTAARLQAVQKTLEFDVDQLADNVHKLRQRVRVAGRQADAVLRRAAERLKQRQDRERRSAGTKEMPIMEVLRSLGSLLPEGGGPGL
ncbi:hypothetical protein PWT90_05423 [Aphanocladium album]|nr:hypothetical protein PWT90_05423 [Aphanocladium album]